MEAALDFTGRTLLVTGSGRNIGRAIVLEFAGRGANVVINARSNTAETEEVADEARRLGAKTLIVMGDASLKETVEEMRRKAEETFGRVDMYVANAAKRLNVDFFDTTDEQWHYHLNQQVTGAWYLARAFVPAMKEAGWGRIVHINGNDGIRGDANRIPHSVGKGALRTLTTSLALSLGQYGITVNDVYPGFVATKRDAKTHPEVTGAYTDSRLKILPLRRQPVPEELAWACAFLCSPRSGAINGGKIATDGGELYVQAR